MRSAIDSFRRKLDAILSRLNDGLENSESMTIRFFSNVTNMTRVTRRWAQKMDPVVSDSLERARARVVRADATLTRKLEAVENAVIRTRRSLLGQSREEDTRLKVERSGIDHIGGTDPLGGPEEQTFCESADDRFAGVPPAENHAKESARASMVNEVSDAWSAPRSQSIPRSTYSPAVLALGIACLLWGMVTTYLVSLLGLLFFILGLAGWIGELRHEHESR